jgi:thioester reductase-like protein
MRIKGLQPDTDLFSAGVDSLQVLSISKFLRAGLAAGGGGVDDADVSPRVIYSNPTLEQLASHIYTAVHKKANQDSVEDTKEISITKSLISKYTRNLPAARSGRSKPLDERQTIVLTGSTGSLGAYLLDMLCKSPQVQSIICLNRGEDGGKSRQPGVSAARGLDTDFSKVEFLSSDTSRPDLGLGAMKYKEMLGAVDRIIHNAWPVNFNISVSSFEPYIRGVRNLVDFSSAAPKQVPIIFISSIGTVQNWNSPARVPEDAFSDPSLARMGYGLSKLASSLILDAASEKSGVPSASIRVGQIAGPRGTKGKWNPQEFLPSLIASSVHLGILPNDLGSLNVVDWLPIEDVAEIILDVAGITQKQDVSNITGYFHCVNTKTAIWADLAAAIEDSFDGRIRELVSLETWVAALERSAADNAGIDKNPAVKLLDTYRGFVGVHGRHVHLEMKRTVSRSRAAANLGPITAELMRNWCAQWGY